MFTKPLPKGSPTGWSSPLLWPGIHWASLRINSPTYTRWWTLIRLPNKPRIKMQTILGTGMRPCATLRSARSAAAANSTTLVAQRRVCLAPGRAQLLGAGYVRLGSLSVGGKSLQQAVCSSGVAHPGEVSIFVTLSQILPGICRPLGADTQHLIYQKPRNPPLL